MSALRPIIIALGTVAGGVAIYAGVIYFFHLPPTEPGKTIVLLSSFAAAAVVSILATRRMAPSRSGENLTIEEMEKQGLLIREKYEATRTFQVEEFEDEGCQYFIELKNGSVLYLCGQYLYDYKPMDGPDAKQVRRFPCTEFTVLRHRQHGWIVDVVCCGKVMEPECEAPPSLTADFASNQAPGDGDIISDRSYDEIKRERMKG